MQLRFISSALLVPALLAGVASTGAAADTPTFEITIKDHRFDPEDLKVPAGTKVKLLVKNLDATPEEFESYDLNREKVVRGRKQIIIFIGPLKPGTYGFFGDFHPKTAKGRIIAE